jgi:predicted O-methyltransferase YrrM
MNFFFRAFRFVKYYFSASTAHGLHSPFVFDLYTNIITQHSHYYAFDEIESIRSKMLLSLRKINVKDFGTAGKAGGKQRSLSVSFIAENYVKPRKCGQLLFRLVNHFESKNILEIGTSLGITTLYLATPDSHSKVITLEGSDETADVAANNFERLSMDNIEIIVGEFSQTLPIAISKMDKLDFVYFDGNHRREATINYFHQCLAKRNEESVFVFDDIYWSKEMSEAWNEIKNHEEVSISIDLFEVGIIFFRKTSQQEHFVLKF